MVEIGGTVGDIESLPVSRGDPSDGGGAGPSSRALFMHLTLVPYIATSGEIKTKPTQHSVKELRSIGIQPDILLCRADRAIPGWRAAQDRPLHQRAGKGGHLGGGCRLHLPHSHAVSRPGPRRPGGEPVPARRSRRRPLRVGAGDRRAGAYRARGDHRDGRQVRSPHRGVQVVVGSPGHAGIHTRTHGPDRLRGFGAGGARGHRVCSTATTPSSVPGGFGERGVEGKIATVRYARENGIPYLGICLGMQVAVIEYRAQRRGTRRCP